MSYKVHLIRGTAIYDITEIAGKIEWGDSTDTIGADMSLTVAISPELGFDVKTKDIVILFGDCELFRGIIVDISKPLDDTKTCRIYDFAYYMGQSKLVIQFNGISAIDAITMVCEKCGITVGGIPETKASIKKVYFNESPADIITDILLQEFGDTSQTFFMEVRGSVFYIFKPFRISGRFKPSENIADYDVTNVPSSLTMTESITDISNSVVIVSGSAENYRVVAEVSDAEDIKRYGLRQYYEVIEDKNISQAANIANNMLKQFNKVVKTLSAEFPGADNIRSGRILTFDDADNGLTGDYLIKNCRHTVDGGVHTMTVDLEEWSN